VNYLVERRPVKWRKEEAVTSLATIALFYSLLFCSCCCSSIVGISSAEDTFEKHQPDCVRRTKKPPVQGGFIFAKTSKSVTHVCSHEYDIEGSKLYQARKRRYFQCRKNLLEGYLTIAPYYFLLFCFFCCSWTGDVLQGMLT
jgi:hypothetical protein